MQNTTQHLKNCQITEPDHHLFMKSILSLISATIWTFYKLGKVMQYIVWEGMAAMNNDRPSAYV